MVGMAADSTTCALPDSPPTAPGDRLGVAAPTTGADPRPERPLMPASPPTAPLGTPPIDAARAAAASTVGRRRFRRATDAARTPADPPNAPAGTGRLRRLLGLVALVAVAGGAGGVVGAAVGDEPTTTPPTATGATTTPLVSNATAGGTDNGSLDVGAVLDAVEGAVADIQASGPRQAGQGTGIVYTADGLVLTNAHVVEGATAVTVTTTRDRQPRRATVVGTDPDNDVAVLRVEDTDGLVVAQLGRSADTRVGEDVVAIGNALGLRGDPSVTRGIVSALDRTIGDLAGLLQTDAAINSGNSGGPLVNAAGQVIGINTAIAVQNNAQNIGFAIPIDRAKAIADRLVGGEAASPIGFLGVTTSDNTQGTTGATVIEVTAGSPADEAGLRSGDVIVAVGDDAVSGAAALSRLVAEQPPGSTIELTVIRDGGERKLQATLGRR